MPLSSVAQHVADHLERWDEAQAAWEDGYRSALFDIAERHVELDQAWVPIGHVGYEQAVAGRVAEFERCAVTNTAATWCGFYPGGPVDFETGRLDNGAELPGADR